jgi:hypothetical protein
VNFSSRYISVKVEQFNNKFPKIVNKTTACLFTESVVYRRGSCAAVKKVTSPTRNCGLEQVAVTGCEIMLPSALTYMLVTFSQTRSQNNRLDALSYGNARMFTQPYHTLLSCFHVFDEHYALEYFRLQLN